MLIIRLHEEIAAVCPIRGVSSDGRIDFDPAATAQQQSDAAAVVAAYVDTPQADETWQLGKRRQQAKDYLDDQLDAAFALDRAIVLVVLAELNLLRQWIKSFKAEVAASTNLANLQSRVASLPNLPQRTPEQVKAAIKQQISDGNVDT